MSKLDVDAVRAVARLIDRGFEAYLVGGCVRDLLLDRTPKDYDIATEARPPQVKRTFPRNCRIIGRRFKLAHLHFHGNTKILECSTFRRTPQERSDDGGGDEDLLITHDNEFGNAEEDAMRRDFTVNALFLDPTEDRIVDHVNGLADIEAKVIRTIGDPRVRFREDPVRILRAAKFAGRLGFTVEKETLAAMAETAQDLTRAAPPRVLEEILRLLRGGHALDSFQLLRDVGALKHLIPALGKFLASARHEQRVEFWRLLDALDHHIAERPDAPPPQNGVLLGALLYGPVAAALEKDSQRSASSVAEDLLGPLAADLRLPRRDSGCLKRICGVQHRFVQTEESRRFRTGSFVHSPYFAEALDLFTLRTQADDGDPALVAHWRKLAGDTPYRGSDDDEQDFDDRNDNRAAARGADHHAAVEATPLRDEASEDAERDDTDPGAPERPGTSDSEEHGDGRRRRRRRRSNRGSRREDSEQGAAERSAGEAADRIEFVTPSPAAGDSEGTAGQDEGAARQDRKNRHSGGPDSGRGDVGRGDESEAADPRDADEQGDVAGATDTAPSAGSHDDEGDGADRKRRRRRRRRGRQRDDTFPLSDEPQPHGDAREPQLRHDAHDGHGPTDDGAAFPRDEAAGQFAEEHAPDRRSFDDQGDDGDRGDQGDDAGDRAEATDDRPDAATGDSDGRRKRRRRGRRGRGQRDGDVESGNRESGNREAGSREAGSREGAPQPQPRQRQQPRQQQDRPQQPQSQRSQQPAAPQRQQPSAQQPPRKSDEGRDRRGKQRGKRDRDRDRDRNNKGHGSPRDVDVVPRYRDRRGKVEVIEPLSLDLSAFDVELDPKRVPSFGSIVEGNARPKRKGPRVDRDDDYRPPPPPGSGSGSDAPPPPPPPDSDGDTFGDW